MLRITRRNLLVVLLSISVFGLFVYSKIGSRVRILKGTTLTSKSRDLKKLLQDGRNQRLHNMAGDRRDDVSGNRRLSQEQYVDTGVNKSSKSEKEETLYAEQHGDRTKLEELMMKEGFIEGNGPEETEGGVDRDGVEGVSEERVLGQVLPQVPVYTKIQMNVTREPVDQKPIIPQIVTIEEDTVMKPREDDAPSPHKSRIVKIGWTRDREERRLERKAMSQNVTIKPVSNIITSHYFAENPQDAPRAWKIFQKCLSKMSEPDRRSFAEWESHYRKTLPSTINPMSIGQRWIALARYMQALGREQRLPDVLNIGAKKSGTTALGWFLSQHPQISHSFGNEVHFFDKQYERGIEYYKARMNFAKRNQLVFEKTPRYLVTDSAPGHALQDLPRNIKFIICIRDPLKRALSDFRHDSTIQVRRQAKINHRMISAARSPEGEGARFAAGAFDKNGNVNSSFDSVRTSSYVKHFKNWLSYFPRDKFLIVNHQTLVDDAFHELQRIEKFLGLNPYFQPSMFYFDQKRKGTCMKGREFPCPPRSSPGFLPAGKLTPDQERKLRDYFRPLNREFVELVGDNNFTWVDL